MSTIAYRNGMMAADTGMTSAYGARGLFTEKIRRRIDGALAGAVGGAAFCAKFLDWFMAGSEGDPPKGERIPNGGADMGLVVQADGALRLFEPEGSFPVRADYLAIGSGSAEARGAMYAGADAQGAVAAAIHHDDGTYGGVTVCICADWNETGRSSKEVEQWLKAHQKHAVSAVAQ